MRPACSRPRPIVTDLTRPYWTGGADGELRVQQCDACGHLIHPPVLRCPHDHDDRLSWRVVSGLGRVEAWTVNLQPWLPGLVPPYVIALVALDDDPTARVLTNLVDVEEDRIRAGLPVVVDFIALTGGDADDVHLPVFRPAP